MAFDDRRSSYLTSIARRTLLLVISGFGLELFYRKLPGAVGHQLCQSLGDRQPEAGAAEPEQDRLSESIYPGISSGILLVPKIVTKLIVIFEDMFR